MDFGSTFCLCGSAFFVGIAVTIFALANMGPKNSNADSGTRAAENFLTIIFVGLPLLAALAFMVFAIPA